MTRKQYRRAPVREGARMLKGSCGAEREGHPPSKRIRRTRRNRRSSAPPARRKGGLRPLNMGGTTKYPEILSSLGFHCWGESIFFFTKSRRDRGECAYRARRTREVLCARSAQAAPKARRFSRPEDAGCLQRHHLFSRKRKDGGEKSAWGREIALTRRKADRYIARVIVSLSVVRTPFGRP